MIKTTLKITLISLMAFGTITTMNSCKKDSDSNNPSPVVVDTAVYFDCKIDGVELVDDSRFADYTGFGLTRVIAQNDDAIIRIDYPAETTGTYVLNNTSNNVITYVGLDQIRFRSISGSVTITKYDKAGQKISGTFNGVLRQEGGTAQKNVTEGKFNNVRLTAF